MTHFFRTMISDLSERREEVSRLVLMTFIAATVLTLTASGTPYLRNIMADNPDAASEFWEDLLWMSIWLYAWILIVPVIYLLSVRVNYSKGSTVRLLGIYGAGFVFAYVVHVTIQILSMQLPAFQDIHEDLMGAVIHHLLSGVYLIAITYGGIAAACHAIVSHRRSQEVEMRRVRLESELAQARMHALRSQLHPHFLFNALNSVSTLMYRDVRAADEMLAGIGDLLRVLIKESDRHFIALKEEMAFVAMYLKIEKIRHGDRLEVSIEHDAALDHALVPALALQPIVENAIKHGISQAADKGRIWIRSYRDGQRLRLSVVDNGPGFSSGDGPPGPGVGISNLKARLKMLYGEDQSLLIGSSEDGPSVDIVIPLRMESVLEKRERQQ